MSTLEKIGFIESFKIRTHEIDINKRIKIPSLVQLMQEASMSNAIKLGFSVWDLEDDSLSWVLIKKEINITRLPNLGETIKVITYPSGLERLFAYRDFIVKDESGQIIVTASSTWILMNVKTRKVVLPELVIPTPSDIIPLVRPSFKFPKVDRFDIETNFKVNWHDLDWNEHVNNIFILKCMLEGSPDKLLQNGSVKKIRIQFKTESFWKDSLISNFHFIDDNHSLHSVTRQGDDKVIAMAELFWN